MLLICLHRYRINFWWLLQHISLGNNVFEDMVYVFLYNFIIFVLYCASGATITQTTLSHTKPLLTSMPQHFLEVRRNFSVLSYQGEHRYLIFHMFWVYLLYVSFTSAKTQSLQMTHFKYLHELSIKKCNNQSNVIHITQQHLITCTIIIIDLSYLLRNFSNLINIYYIYMNVKL